MPRIFKEWVVLVVVVMSLVAGPVCAQDVNINTADIPTLKTLQNIGDARAAEIVRDREENGPLRSIEDLKRVKGIGDKIFAANRLRITVGNTMTGMQEPDDKPVKSMTEGETQPVKDVTTGH